MVSFDLEVDEVTDSGISCTVTIPSGPLDVSVFVMATFYADVTKGTQIYSVSSLSPEAGYVKAVLFEMCTSRKYPTNS
jgi:hypothetical protein